MAKCFIDDNTLTNIGNAIRSVNGSSDLMLPSAMPDAISLLNSGLYVWKKLTAEGGDFIDFVVSGSETAYPDGAVHTDGYWYEKFNSSTLIPENIREGIDIWGVVGTLVEGVAGIDFGEITLASASETVTVNHALGVAPSFVALFPKNLESANGITLVNVNGKTIRKSSSSWYLTAVTNTLTDTSIVFGTYSNSFKYPAKDYYWIAIA